MKTFLLAIAMLVVFGGVFAPNASASCHYRRAYYGDHHYYGYRPYYRSVYYERPYYYSYHRHYYNRPRIAVFFGF